MERKKLRFLGCTAGTIRNSLHGGRTAEKKGLKQLRWKENSPDGRKAVKTDVQ